MEKLVGQEIRCRIIKLETEDEKTSCRRPPRRPRRRRPLQQSSAATPRSRKATSSTAPSAPSPTTAPSSTSAAADGLLHICDIGWHRVTKPSEDILTVGHSLTLKILKVDAATRKISLGLKQLQPHPWDAVPDKYKVGDRIRGTVTRTTDFGSFVELEPGIEGLIHLTEMSWAKKVRKPSDLLKPGDTVDAIILGINPTERRIALGLKQALGDPWAEISKQFPSRLRRRRPRHQLHQVRSLRSASRRHRRPHPRQRDQRRKAHQPPQDVLRLGQQVTVKILEVDKEKRQLRLCIKQMVPTGLDDFLAEHKQGDTVTGRLVKVSGDSGTVELGEGVLAKCSMTAPPSAEQQPSSNATLDLSDLGSMLKARWKNGPVAETKPEATRTGQIRSFKITKLDHDTKTIELQLA